MNRPVNPDTKTVDFLVEIREITEPGQTGPALHSGGCHAPSGKWAVRGFVDDVLTPAQRSTLVGKELEARVLRAGQRTVLIPFYLELSVQFPYANPGVLD